MPRRSQDDQPRKPRFSRSGHTAHHQNLPPVGAPPPYDDRPTTRQPMVGGVDDETRSFRTEAAPTARRYPDTHRYDDVPDEPPRQARRYTEDDFPTESYAAAAPRRGPYGQPTYHHTPAANPDNSAAAAETAVDLPRAGTTRATVPAEPQTVSRAAGNLAKATASGTGRAAKLVTRKVITASKADGAEESGLTALIWNQVLSYGTDAMVTVALAGTVFFGASSSAQRGNVLLYLLVTMAPFAVVAPIIGPALDRLQHGRRWTMAGTAIGRAVLALIMAGHPTELLVLYPCALGSLVFSKAYGVVRAAAAPRLVPPAMTLTEANARITIFGLGSTLVLGGFVGAVIKVTGSYSAGLVVTAVGFAACAFFAFKLPRQVDSGSSAPRHPEEPIRPRRQDRIPPMARIGEWARKGFDPHLVIALQGESALRLLNGFMTIYLAFYVESTQHGFAGVVELGGVVGAAGAGNFLGTAIGTRLRMARPELVIIIAVCVSAGATLVAAVLFSVEIAIAALLVGATANALGKIALDSLIQNDVVETLRSSAFARSETFLQLAWVLGAAIGVALPSHGKGDGMIAFIVATVLLGFTSALVVLRNRAMKLAHGPTPADPSATTRSVVPRSID